MQAKKDTQKKLLFKFVDEESDDYFKRSDEKELQFDGGNDDDKNKKMAMIVAGVVIVGLLVGFFALRGGAEEEPVEDPLVTPDATPVDADEDEATEAVCAGTQAEPEDADAGCTLAEQGYTIDGTDITDTEGVTEPTATFCDNNPGSAADTWCVDAIEARDAAAAEAETETPEETAETPEETTVE